MQEPQEKKRRKFKQNSTRTYKTCVSICITLCEESKESWTEATEVRFLIGENPVTFPDKVTSEDIRRN
jgi:hypothetical protein